jgi:hypothetical protein
MNFAHQPSINCFAVSKSKFIMNCRFLMNK